MSWITYVVVALISLLTLSCAADFDPKNPRIEDRFAIEDLITKYCNAIDQRDFELYKEVFTSDAVLDYSANWGQGSGNPKSMARQMSDMLSLFSASLHSWSNLDITFTGPNTAKVRVMLDNPMFLRGLPRVALITIYAYYNHEVVKGDDGVWRSKHMSMEIVSPFEHQLLVTIAIFVLLWRTRKLRD